MAADQGVLMLTGNDLVTGVVVPVPTAMSAPDRPDASSAVPHLEALAEAGISTLLLFGSNGEGPVIARSSAREYARATIVTWKRLVPGGRVILNVTAPGTAQARDRAEDAAEVGADAISCSPPFYFSPTDQELVSHYAALAEPGLPVLVYDLPKRTSIISAGAAEKIGALAHVMGVKDSSGDSGQLRMWLAIREREHGRGFCVASGAETQLLAHLQGGADGVVPGTAIISPRSALALFRALQAGDLQTAGVQQEIITSLTAIHRIRPGVPVIKALLANRGLMTPHASTPFSALSTEEQQQVAAFYEAHDAELLGEDLRQTERTP